MTTADAAVKTSSGTDAVGVGGPLAGVRILDLTSVLMGPWATQQLGDLGADVICVEAAGGDPARFYGNGRHPQFGGVAMNVLRNKRNIALDLKNPAGRSAFLKIAATCDIVVTNLRPGPRARLGLTYEDVKAVKPDIIYCHTQGWSLDSGQADDPAYDDVAQVAAGMGAVFAMQNGKPGVAPISLGDQVGSMTIVYALLAALYHHARTGQGQCVEVPMVEAVNAFVNVMHGKDGMFEPPLGPAGFPRLATPLRAPVETKDGHLQLVLYSKANWVDLFTAGGVVDAENDPRLATPNARNDHYLALYDVMFEIMKTRTTAEWLTWCKQHNVACSPVTTLEEIIATYPVAEHPLAGRYRRAPIPVRYSETPPGVRREAPVAGQHNVEILAEIGLSPEEIAQIEKDGGFASGDNLGR